MAQVNLTPDNEVLKGLFAVTQEKRQRLGAPLSASAACGKETVGRECLQLIRKEICRACSPVTSNQNPALER